MLRPKPQELYRHFKGGKYQVITIARDADTGEEQVVYQALYGDYTVYCRPLKEFTSEVDRTKYPNADQRMRFEPFVPDEGKAADEAKRHFEIPKGLGIGEKRDNTPKTADRAKEDEAKNSNVIKPEPIKKNDSAKTEENDFNPNYMNRTIEQEAEEFGMNPLVVRFLDAGSSSERLEVLNLIRPIVTNDMIDIMAMSIDTEIPGDDPDLRCGELRECLLTKQRFEVTRLRS
ncbi:DUF1653 domain-containing protein [Butyrivibrio sp. AE3004]|uniref:DUF1653 domain-containing protein n=1 Tax=Butyrivibrio sp. AE3004 TaxID=1506994 RepID=UPI00068EF919|nr:DUF1653 domain-containing protein [Butyrivibrio sp. AE3004]